MSETLRDEGGSAALAAAQHWLCQRVMRPLGERAEPDDAAGWVLAGKLSSSERVAVYQRAYFARLVECLGDDYPALAQSVGADEFEARCVAFIEAHPPASSSLNYYGAPFADFCSRWASSRAVFWSELARLEWAVVECIHAAAEHSLDPRELGALSEEQWSRARLVRNPAARIVETRYPVHAHYEAFLAGDRPEPPAPRASTIIVCRRDERISRLEVEPRWAALLGALVNGERVARALAELPSHATPESVGGENGAPADSCAAALERTLSAWVALGLFAGVSVD